MPLREILASPPGSAPFGGPAVVHPHTILVSLPAWQDLIDFALRTPAHIAKVKVGYPRFFVHKSVRRLVDVCLQVAAKNEVRMCLDPEAMAFPTARVLNECVSFLARRSPAEFHSDIQAVHFNISGPNGSLPDSLHVLIYPKELEKEVFFFWLNAGMGISGRHAEYILRRLESGGNLDITQAPCESLLSVSPGALEEKWTLKTRIADLLNGGIGDGSSISHTDRSAVKLGVQPNHVFLYTTGMAAIWHAHQLTTCLFPGLKAASFGYLYLDSLQVYRSWGEGIIPYFKDHDTNLREFEQNTPNISALLTELPSNPTLTSPNLARIRKLADEHGFLVVVDETVGNFVNTDILQYADIVCTSLSKLFSGSANVLGGSLAINPNSRHYTSIQSHLDSTFVDDLYSGDAVVLEFNSRDFYSRVRTVNANAVAVANFLRSRSRSFRSESSEVNRLAITNVLFPEWVSRENYDICRRPCADSNNFGYLVSITFVSVEASKAFYDALECVKAPTIGTNFTLAVPYAVLAHYNELSEVKNYGIDETLIRLSVGTEELDVIMGYIQRALEVAEKTVTYHKNP
ncbi:Cystathionine gamma-synthase [Marasmius tenuissimus]|uniref:Cystathionine gamma-synthase n=1 Tax=Marasmius tenuissimus TaxID=585030 RepID=A0ABR2ZAA1_9AGAR